MARNHCPKCDYQWDFASVDCPKCGIVLSKLTDKANRPEDQVLAPVDLVKAWQELVVAYDDISLHERFIQKALQFKKLNFASQQYRKMLELNPEDEIARKMQESIIQLASFQVMSAPRAKAKPSRLLSLLCFICAVMIFCGYLLGLPFLQYLGIAGLAMCFFVLYRRSATVE